MFRSSTYTLSFPHLNLGVVLSDAVGNESLLSGVLSWLPSMIKNCEHCVQTVTATQVRGVISCLQHPADMLCNPREMIREVMIG